MSALFAVLLAVAYLLVMFGVLRLARWFLHEQDRRAQSEFRAQQLLAAMQARYDRDLQFREANVRG